jgi:hypothetical protein
LTTAKHLSYCKCMVKMPVRSRVLIASGILAVTLFIVASPLLLFNNAYAGTLTSSKVTISDSRASATTVTYDLAFTTTVTTDIKTFGVEFCTTAASTCTDPGGTFTVGSPTLGSDNFAGTGRTTTAPNDYSIKVLIGTPATQSTQAVTVSFTGLTNPTTADTTYFARLYTCSSTETTCTSNSASLLDSGVVAFAILTTTSIAVSASVDPTFTFTVAGVASSQTVNGATTTITTGAATIPFSTLSDGTPAIGAHDVSVTTNAANGYTVTVKTLADPPLVSGSNNIDKFSGTNASPTTWSAPAGSAANTNTGYFGYTTNDGVLGTGTTDRFTSSGGNKWAGATTSPLEVAYKAAGAATADTTRLGWEAEINELQPQGSYTGTVVLVATPTY